MEDDVLKDEDPIEDVDDDLIDDDLGLDIDGKKKKDLIDPDTESIDDLEEEELEEDEEPFDDVNPM